MSFFKKNKILLIQLILFIVTITTTTLAGAEFVGSGSILNFKEFTWSDFASGFYFSIPFLGILTVHEFGHYFTARYYKIKTTLPFYIPFLFMGGLIGTMGAIIRIKDAIKSRKEFFDVGIAGPLAGFVVAIIVLFYGFTHLPGPEYIENIHPDYKQFGNNYEPYVYKYDYLRAQDSINYKKALPDEEFVPMPSYPVIKVGSNLLFQFFENYVVEDKTLIPNGYEIMHYPWIYAGFLALFFTALNLLPMGQLDGGHVVYGLFGYDKHKTISEFVFFAFIFYSGIGIVSPVVTTPEFLGLPPLIIRIVLYLTFLYFILQRMDKSPQTKLMIAVFIMTAQFLISFYDPTIEGYSGWLVFAFIIGRVIGFYHPMALDDTRLSPTRKVLGWISLIVFALSFSPQPFDIEENETPVKDVSYSKSQPAQPQIFQVQNQ